MQATQHAAVEQPPEASPSGPAPRQDSRRLLLLLHGEKANDELVRNAINRLREEGHKVQVRVTYEAGDVDRLVKEAIKLRSADTLVAAGGDGTVCEVVAALLQHTGGLKDTRQAEDPKEPLAQADGEPRRLQELSVGILPMGTSNDFAATTGIPQDPYEALLLATRHESLKPLDVGLLNGKVFMNTATIGASAEVGKVTSSRIKKLLGPAAFLFTGIKSVTGWSPVSSVLCFPNIKETGHLKAHKEDPKPQGEELVKSLGQEVPAKAERAVDPKTGEMITYAAKAAASPTPEEEATGDKPKFKPGTAEEPAGAESTAEAGGSTASTGAATALAAASQTGDDVGELEGVPLLHITAANNRQIASILSVAPNAVLDDGMLDCVYVTGKAGERVKRMLWEMISKGIANTKVLSTLLRVPWLEVAAEKPMEWSLDGEPQDQPSTHFRFSLLHRAVQFHLPDDRMLVAGQPDPEAKDAQLAAARKKTRQRSNPLRLPHGRLHPPSLGDMLGHVVRFRKKKNWGAIVRGTVKSTLKTALVAGLGGLLVHWWHLRQPTSTGKQAANSKKVTQKQPKANKPQKRRHFALAGF